MAEFAILFPVHLRDYMERDETSPKQDAQFVFVQEVERRGLNIVGPVSTNPIYASVLETENGPITFPKAPHEPDYIIRVTAEVTKEYNK